jgi:predicted MFS family arabinose efflux permease
VRLRLHFKSARHREESAKLAAGVLNGVAIACLIGATFGPWLNPALGWSLSSVVLFGASAIFHVLAQVALRAGFEETP